ncbi:sigma-70 family RNA polymerase sigma factor [Tissierella pigra]|uniref:Sigma-70 family RNA polymerase sigma factor n=1 Tax=Tissierella pigra TaxID=2607614 RepID=A0A6N7XJZ1_9FIRM|nr:sigma-70 family RNA polymerase sigma factor [Tissierella pigra]MSU01896.1 sigma-70 family RNA polymerase sigma factor [Tissierella pigra]
MEGVDRETFILQNMGLVRMVVNKHAYRIVDNPFMEKEDLENIGVIGLIKAYERFDPNFGTQFSTYAVPMIEGEIQRFIRDNSDTVRFTRQSKSDYYEILGADLLNENPEVIADILEIPIERVRNALDYYRCKYIDSLDREIYDDEGKSISMTDKIGTEVDFDSNLEIELFLNKLDERTRKIVELRLQEKTQMEIAEILGISQVQVSRILMKLQKTYKGGNEVTKKNNTIIVKDTIAESIKLVKETDLTPTQIQKQTGVSYPTARKLIKEHRDCIEKKTPDFTLAKKLAEETELNPSQISKKTGVAYTTARKYVGEYRIVKEKEIPVEKVFLVENVIPNPATEHRLDIPEEVAQKEIIEEPEINPANGFMTMTLKLTVEDASNQLKDIINAMEVLGFEELNVTIQSQQVA